MTTEFLTIKKTFSQVEKEMLSHEMVSKWNEKQEIEAQKKEATKSYSAKIKSITNHISLLSKQIKQGYAEEEVECFITKDFKAGVKNYTDKNTGDLIHSEKLQPHEMQMEI